MREKCVLSKHLTKGNWVISICTRQSGFEQENYKNKEASLHSDGECTEKTYRLWYACTHRKKNIKIQLEGAGRNKSTAIVGGFQFPL